MKKAACVLMAFWLLVACQSANGQRGKEATTVAKEAHAKKSNPEPAPRFDRQPVRDREGELLPRGAIMRLGTTRFRAGSVITSLVYSSNGEYLASGDKRGRIIIWDPSSGKRRLTIQGPSSVESLAISPDGRLLASEHRVDSRIVLFNAASGKKIRQFEGEKEGVDSVTFSPDGKWLASRMRDRKKLRVWDVASGQVVRELGHDDMKGYFGLVAFSPNGKLLACDGKDGQVLIFSVKDGQLLQRLDMDVYLPFQIAFHPGGKILGVLGTRFFKETKMAYWEVGSGRLIRQDTIVGSDRRAFAFSMDGSKVAIGGKDTMTEVYHFPFKKKKLWKNVWKRLPGNQIGTNALAFSPDHKVLASAGEDGAVVLWSLKTGKRLSKSGVHTEAVLGVAFSHDGRLLASASGDKTVRFWELKTGQSVCRLEGHNQFVHYVGFSRNDEILFSQSDGEIILWDIEKNLKRCNIRVTGPTGKAVFSPHNNNITASWYKKTRIWDSNTCQELRRVENKHNDRRIGWLDHGNELILVGADEYSLQNMTTGEIRIHKSFSESIKQALISFDGKIFITQSLFATGTIVIRKTESGEVEKELKTGMKNIHRLSLSKDAKYLAATDTAVIQVWNLADGKLIRELTGHVGSVWDLAFSPDGCLLVSAGLDSTVLIWETGALGCVVGKNQGRPKDG